MSHGKQFTLFTHTGPHAVTPDQFYYVDTNSMFAYRKVVFVFEELGLTYESVYLDFSEMKKLEYTKYNPNGRIPTIIRVDHSNNEFVVWESDAILQYLVDKYDKDYKISVAGDERYHQLQWLYFQASGQGPYYGQVAWFTNYHPEKVPSAIERYRNEIKRVLSVLESVLSKQEWLVGGKMTIADLSLYPWNEFARRKMFEAENSDFAKEYPATAAWHKKLADRPSVKKASADLAALRK